MCLHKMWSGNINRNLINVIIVLGKGTFPICNTFKLCTAIHLCTHTIHTVTCMHNYTKVTLTWLNKNHCWLHCEL